MAGDRTLFGWTAAALGLLLLVNVILIGVNAGRGAGGGTYEGVAILGKASAPVTIVEYSDFQCPFCKRFHDDAYQQVKAAYIDTGKAKLLYRDFPLTSLHPMAQKAAEAGKCALAQGNERFWKLHDLIFANQAQLSVDGLKLWAAQAGVDTARFNACLDNGEKASAVAAELLQGQQQGIRGTPGFLIYGPGESLDGTGTAVSGAQPFSAFQTVIDAKLAG